MRDKSNLPTVVSRITEYLDNGGLWNPELADHAAVRDLICDARDEIDRLCDDLQKQADWADWAKGEIDRLRDRFGDVEAERNLMYTVLDDTRKEFGVSESAIWFLCNNAKVLVQDLRSANRRADRAERILAALREPSEQVKKAVGRDEFMRLFTGEWETIPVGYDLTASMIRAAVAAAEQVERDRAERIIAEVGRE